MPPKKDKLKCYTLKANDGHKYVTCDDKTTASKAMTKVKEAMKEVNGIKGKPKLKKQFAEKAKAEIDRDLPDDVLNLINEFAKPHRDMAMVVDFNFVIDEIQKKRDAKEGGMARFVYGHTPEVAARRNVYFQQFINRIKELGENPNDYVQSKQPVTHREGIFYRKPTKKIEHIISVSDKKAPAAFKKRSGLDRMVATTSVTFVFPTPIGVGGGVGLDKKMPIGIGRGNIDDRTYEITNKDRERIFASAKYKKFEKDAESKGWYDGINRYQQQSYGRPPKKSFAEWLKDLK